MKIIQIKNKVYQLTSTRSTAELKKARSELVKGKDLRYKENWISIYSTLRLVDEFAQSQTGKQVAKKHDFKTLDSNSSFEDLLHNVKSMGCFAADLEQQFNEIESKISADKDKK